MDAIVAVYSDWGIGDGQTQPVVLKADRRHFKELTMGRTVIVGRKTFEDFPGGKPLPGRRNIVVSRSCPEIPGAEVAASAEEALDMISEGEACFVIGGAGIFRLFYPVLDRVFLTRIDCAPASTAFFPDLDSSPCWVCTDAGENMSENGIGYRFCTYERIKKEDL